MSEHDHHYRFCTWRQLPLMSFGLLRWPRIGANTVVGNAPNRRNPHAEPTQHRTQNVPTKSPNASESGELIEAEMAHEWSCQIEREGERIDSRMSRSGWFGGQDWVGPHRVVGRLVLGHTEPKAGGWGADRSL